jgi:hypothetical protein
MPSWRTVLPIASAVAMAAVAAAAVVVAIDNAPQLGPSADEPAQLEARVASLERELTDARADLGALRDRLKETKKGLARERRRAAELRRLSQELALADGDDTCSTPDTPQVAVEILDPANGEVVSSPVRVHLLVTEPLGCEASYYLSVDGVPYAPQEGGAGAGTPGQPLPYAPFEGGTPAEACITNAFTYVSLDLETGAHSLDVNAGCERGNDPPTVPTSTSFVVD